MLTVGQLARIFNVSTKTLRHYDAIGLFIPASVGGENSYRYYAPDQLGELKRILFLRSMGVGLEVLRELKECGALHDDKRIKRILEEQADTIRRDIERQHQLLQSVEQMIDWINHAGRLEIETRIVKKSAFKVVGMEWHSIKSQGSIPDMWERFNMREHEIRNKVKPDVAYGICITDHEQEFSYVAGFEVHTEEIPDGMISLAVPEQTYAVFSHRGKLDGIGKTMNWVYGNWLPQSGLQPVLGMDFELYDERFLGTDNDATEIDLYVPIHEINR